eukprot:TRINITY_DN355_c0_g1_i1.p1 TRINITY_DN355_c0_g1~~TRINITY_DN355_c0_g1_i1.p1  ORF type:complete len:259 (+),score=54.29 TRINITY_DN355_c0_g1_i1:55-831(+)
MRTNRRRMHEWDDSTKFSSFGNEYKHVSYRKYFFDEGSLSRFNEYLDVVKRNTRHKKIPPTQQVSSLYASRDPKFRNTKLESAWDPRASVSVSIHNPKLHVSQREYFDQPRELRLDGTHSPRYLVDEWGHKHYMAELMQATPPRRLPPLSATAPSSSVRLMSQQELLQQQLYLQQQQQQQQIQPNQQMFWSMPCVQPQTQQQSQTACDSSSSLSSSTSLSSPVSSSSSSSSSSPPTTATQTAVLTSSSSSSSQNSSSI